MKSHTSYISFIFFFFLMVACNSTSEEQTENNDPVFHASHEPSRANRPFSDAVQVGNTFYLTGQIGLDHKTGELVEGGIEEETRQTLENIKDVLAHHKMDLDDVVKATVILDTIGDFSAFNTIYIDYFPNKPARTTFAAETLARNAKIEIEVVAVRPD